MLTDVNVVAAPAAPNHSGILIELGILLYPVTFSVRHGPDFSVTGTQVVNAGITVTNTTTGLSTTAFDNATITGDSFVWISTSATAGTVDLLHVTILF